MITINPLVVSLILFFILPLTESDLSPTNSNKLPINQLNHIKGIYNIFIYKHNRYTISQQCQLLFPKSPSLKKKIFKKRNNKTTLHKKKSKSNRSSEEQKKQAPVNIQISNQTISSPKQKLCVPSPRTMAKKQQALQLSPHNTNQFVLTKHINSTDSDGRVKGLEPGSMLDVLLGEQMVNGNPNPSIDDLKNVIREKDEYISQLQELLQQNNIKFK